MMLKFESKEQWVVFGEIDHIEYGKADEKAGHDSELLEYPASANDAAVGTKMRVSFFTKNMTAATEIHAFSPIYIMNDEGRTVETI